MKIMKKSFFVILILIAGLLASRRLFRPGYFNMHDDLQMMRQLQMEKCWKDGQIPCRWVPDMGFGYGYPLFNFYPPLPFYVGQFFRLFGFSFVNTAKILFGLQFLASGITMFVLASDLWGIFGGLISSIFYIWAPYHAVDVYVRGALNEAWAFIWFPLILWSVKKLAEKEKLKYVIWLAFSTAMLLLTHNVMVMIFIPVGFVWLFYWLIRYHKLSWKNKKLFGFYFLSGLWGLGLAAFFTLPMFFEKKFTHVDSMFSGYYNWRAHFVSLNQLFISRFWGYGPSLWKDQDGMAFPVGHWHWILTLIISIVAIFQIFISKFKNKKFKINLKHPLLIILFGALGMVYAFLIHEKSTFIWLNLPFLQLAQFSWRLLAVIVLLTSLIAGISYKILPLKSLGWILIIGVVAFNWSFFRPERMGPLTDQEKFSGKAWEFQQTAGIRDYLPISAKWEPKSAPDEDWLFLDGQARDVKTDQGSNWFYWQGEVTQPGRLAVNIFHFPGWKVWVDDQPAEVFLHPDDELGRNQVELGKGKHQVYFQLTDTPIRKWSNLWSLLSWFSLLIIISHWKWKWLPIT